MQAFPKDLLSWYDKNKRSLPWRDVVIPYRTWISEVMLQQTRVETVLPYFDRFMKRFPTVEDLAAAPEDDVLSMWSGLGYYSRARNMHASSKMIVAAGRFPSTLVEIRQLPGVGEYIAGAIASIAFGLDEPAVDGNLHRVLSRIYCDGGNRKAIISIAKKILPTGRAGDFNQALMDLGSKICKPKKPHCTACPVEKHCKANDTGQVLMFPVKAKKKKAPQRTAVAAVIWSNDEILLCRRPSTGLYGGLYDFPGGILNNGEADDDGLKRLLKERLDVKVKTFSSIGSVKHTLTHMKLTLQVISVEFEGQPKSDHYTHMRWVKPQSLGTIGVSTLATKALDLLGQPQKTLFN